MGISSLGIGSSILTQSVVDQLREADELRQVRPVTLEIASEGDKKDALALIDESMSNLIDSINEIKSHGLFDERSATVDGTSVEVSTDANSDIQEFTLEVVTLATKQIEQSGSFAIKDEPIASGSGSINLNIDPNNFTIDYDATTTLDDLKKAINDTAGDEVDATVVQIDSGDFRLFISSADTGSNQNITISDNANPNLIDNNITTGLSSIQNGIDAEFKFNGQDVTRSSNSVTDLISGLDITLKEVGLSSVSIAQDRENIMDKMDNFIDKYNYAMTELNNMTKVSIDSSERGIFSSESTIKGMKNSIEEIMLTIGGGAGYISDYGFDIDKDGTLSIDKTILETKLDENSANVEAFFAGGIYTNNDLSTTELDGAFTELSTKVEEYTKYNATLDQLKDSISETISSLEDRKASASEHLDSKYEILKKQFAAYDAIIAKFNSASSMFTQMANVANNNSN